MPFKNLVYFCNGVGCSNLIIIKYTKKMKTLTKGILGVAITAACAYCGYTTYDSYIYQQENALLLANVEALGQNESGGGGGDIPEPSVCQGLKIYSELV